MNAISLPKIASPFAVRHETLALRNPQRATSAVPPRDTDPPGTIPQLETADNFRGPWASPPTQHIFSPNILADVRGMIRDNSNDLNSNSGSWPIAAFQHNDFKEGYFNSAISIHHAHQEWKAGIDVRQSFPSRKLQRPQSPQPKIRRTRSLLPIRSGYARYFRPSPAAALTYRTGGLSSGPHPPRQLDRQRRTALGSLSAHRESKRRQPALFGRALISPQRT